MKAFYLSLLFILGSASTGCDKHRGGKDSSTVSSAATIEVKAKRPNLTGSYRCYGTKYAYTDGSVQTESTTQYLEVSDKDETVILSGFTGCAVIMDQAFGLSESGISCKNIPESFSDGGITVQSKCSRTESTISIKAGDESNYNAELLSISNITANSRRSFTLTTIIEKVRSGSLEKAQLTLNCNEN